MKKLLLLAAFGAVIISISPQFFNSSSKGNLQFPNDWIYAQRAYPNTQINIEKYREAQQEMHSIRQNMSYKTQGTWQNVGPLNIGGRISDIDVHPSNPDKIYVGAASGGIFRVTNNGQTIEPIFDNEMSISVGDLAIDPSDTNTIYVGTGESSASSNTGAFPGNGIYKSTDGGDSWEHKGLDSSFYIGRIVVDSKNSDNIYVAAMGKFWGKNEERGIYRSQDGGDTWQKVLYLNDSTGCIDIVIHPDNPDTLYAAMWTRIRKPGTRICAGPSSGVYRSVDGGDNWTLLTNGLPTSNSSTGKIGLAISESDPNIVYAAYATHEIYNYFDNLYKTTNNGNSWVDVDQSGLSNAYSSFGWYFGNLRVDPNDPDVVYVVGFRTYKSTNGGVNFSPLFGYHVDQHALWIDPSNSNHLVLGNDGGLYTSTNGGNSWTHNTNLPITQFYQIEVDYQNPNRYYGGTQDNGTNRTLTGNDNDWHNIYGGDGFYVIVDPVDNNYVYAESQYGNIGRSTNGGNSFSSADNGINGGDRFNWNSPIVMDPSDHNILYFCSQRVYKTTNQAQNWTAISNDLTNGPGNGNLSYGTITTLDVSPQNPDVIYVGTEDGNVWNTTDGGNNWNLISATLPDLWATRVVCDPHDENIAYVTFSGYPFDNYDSHIYKTIDGGSNWNSISGDLPSVPLNDLIIDPDSAGYLYLASDFGAWFSFNDGQNWEVLGIDLPNVPVFDFDFHQPTRTLIAGTYGRSMYTFDVEQIEPPVLGLNDLTASIGFKAYPNPTKGMLNITWQAEVAGMGVLLITDLSGKEVLRKNIQVAEGSNNVNVDLKQLPSAKYIAQLNIRGKSITQKIVKD